MALIFSGPVENREGIIKSLTVRVSNESDLPAEVMLDIYNAPQPNNGPSPQVQYVQRLVSQAPNSFQTFDNIFTDLPVVDVVIRSSNEFEEIYTFATITAKDAAGSVLPGMIQSHPGDPIAPVDPIFPTGPIDNENRTIKSLVARAANEGSFPASVLLEVFHGPQPNDGPSPKVLYVQRLVSLPPNMIQTFDNIFADLPVVEARMTALGEESDLVAVSFYARDAAGSVIPGVIQPFPVDPIAQSQ